MSKKMNDESKEQIDESENVMYDDLDCVLIQTIMTTLAFHLGI